MSDGHGGHGRRRGDHEEEHEEHENHERWLVSYGDMMTLLMVLFLVMFAVSQVDSKKYMALMNGLATGFGQPVAMLYGADSMLDPGGSVQPDDQNITGTIKGETCTTKSSSDSSTASTEVDTAKVSKLVNALAKAAAAKEADKLAEAEQQLQQALIKAGLANGATFRFDERGLVVTIATDKVLFASGSAQLLPQGQRILNALAPTLAGLSNKISIDGYTDSNPINTAQYPSNWELSSARAIGVLKYLASSVDVDRMSATGFGQTHPLKSGTSAAAMAANRRVEVVVLASVDNTAGRAVAEVATQDSRTTTTATPSASSGATSSGTTSSGTSGSSATPSASTH